jgi:galactose-1-phosphate uridylyltransferase
MILNALEAFSSKTKFDIASIKSIVTQDISAQYGDTYPYVIQWRNIAISTFGVGSMAETTIIMYRPIWRELTDVIE